MDRRQTKRLPASSRHASWLELRWAKARSATPPVNPFSKVLSAVLMLNTRTMAEPLLAAAEKKKEEVTIYLSGQFPCRAAFVPQMSTCHFQHPFCHQLPSTGSTMKNGKPVSVDTPLISPFKTQYMCKNIHRIFQLWCTKELQQQKGFCLPCKGQLNSQDLL